MAVVVVVHADSHYPDYKEDSYVKPVHNSKTYDHVSNERCFYAKTLIPENWYIQIIEYL